MRYKEEEEEAVSCLRSVLWGGWALRGKQREAIYFKSTGLGSNHTDLIIYRDCLSCAGDHRVWLPWGSH